MVPSSMPRDNQSWWERGYRVGTHERRDPTAGMSVKSSDALSTANTSDDGIDKSQAALS